MICHQNFVKHLINKEAIKLIEAEKQLLELKLFLWVPKVP